MEFFRSNFCKNLACALIFSSFFIFVSCGDNAQTDSDTGDSIQASGADTTHSGLEGTRDQQASLSTDVKGDTSSGQGAKTKQVDSTSAGDTTPKK
jgi:hypothetical protein